MPENIENSKSWNANYKLIYNKLEKIDKIHESVENIELQLAKADLPQLKKDVTALKVFKTRMTTMFATIQTIVTGYLTWKHN